MQAVVMLYGEHDHYIGSEIFDYADTQDVYVIADRIASRKRAHLHTVQMSCFRCMEPFSDDDKITADPDSMLPIHQRCFPELSS